MHLILILLSLAFAIICQRVSFPDSGTWAQRWQRSLIGLILPPLMLLMTAVAVIWMGPVGQMLGRPTGWLGYGLAWGLCGWALILGLILTVRGWISILQVRSYRQIEVNQMTVRLLENPVLFCAQIGFWHPELVVSQGLLKTLTPDQQQAVFVHEQAHHYYRDTFWFFGLGWCRRLTAWLPYTEPIWQELLLLRELRADRRASQQIDPLLLAETLLLMVRQPVAVSEENCAAFSCTAPANRITERIEALLSDDDSQSFESDPPINSWNWSLLVFVFLPLITVPFHHHC
ncbi:M56 family metallopeptidase [Capilliphycus salinus ALCB114379]|uniref:M56 family metallopeptidase n=1 Tax=Capilliphycus salinus TaxID=2768948 RepID=UPI0039A60D48